MPARAAERVIKIGLDMPLSGIDGASALPARNAVLLAIEDANRRGFSGGVTLALDDLDDAVQGKHDPAQGAQNMRAFVADPAVVAVLGPMNSNVAEAEIPVGNAAGLAQISMAATSVGLTHLPEALKYRPAAPDRPTFFRVCASDDLQGAAVARFARDLGVRRVFVIDDNESYGRGLADVFSAAFPAAGGTILGREPLTPFALDFQALLTKVRGTRPDAVFFGGIVSTGGAVLRRQMGDVGLGTIPYFGGDGLASPEYVSLAGAGANDTYFTLVSPDVYHLPAAKRFVAAYRARFKGDPGNYSAPAYAAAAVAIAAIRREVGRGSGAVPARDAILRAIAGTARLPTPIGPVSFDGRGDLQDPVIGLYRVFAGKATFVRQEAVRP
jgi:branched-chain amino acid transport system substrate-binding protein